LANDRPSEIAEYKTWLKEQHGVAVDRRVITRFESVASTLQRGFESCTFWVELVDSLKDYHEEYLLKTGYHLFTSLQRPEIVTKPFESFLLKTFRANILDNPAWPDEPIEGWVLPGNWYSRIHDIVRTCLVVKYLDGMEFVIGKIEDLCAQKGLHCEVSFEAREEGYYAAHVNVQHEFEIPTLDWNTERIEAHVEIQLTTQLQDVIRKLLHEYYERRRRRVGSEEDATKWQWDYRSDEFVANYLGHILHYVEGMIMDVRDKQAETRAEGLVQHSSTRRKA
jgi:hypothetical protein